MRSTRNMKRQTNLFLSSLKDEITNKGAADELEIYGRHYKKVVIHPEKILRIYYDH